MFIIGSCMVKVKDGAAQLPEAFNLRSQVLGWYYTNSDRTVVYMKPECYVDKKTLKAMKVKQKKVLVDKKNMMYLPADLLKRAEGKLLRINGLADVLEMELIPVYAESESESLAV
ncbi:MAG: hypothetical protein Q4F21_06385 [Lachnospiraceae bacterium]|nr:hypothetical protein [Lachnospiraceae bacterium]